MPKLLGALHAAEHALISLLPLWTMCGRWDMLDKEAASLLLDRMSSA